MVEDRALSADITRGASRQSKACEPPRVTHFIPPYPPAPPVFTGVASPLTSVRVISTTARITLVM